MSALENELISILVFFIIPLSVACVALYYSFYYLQQARNIEDVPSSKIRSAAQGYVELRGVTASLNPALTTKLSKLPCVWYGYRIEVWRKTSPSSQSEGQFELIREEKTDACFLLKDETDECIVFPKFATFIPPPPLVWYGYSVNPPPPPQSFWEKLWNAGPYRYIEYRLEKNVPLYVSGMFSTIQKGDSRLHPLINTALDLKSHTTVNLLSAEGLSRGYEFLISAKPSRTIVKGYHWKALGFFIIFMFLVAATFNKNYATFSRAMNNFPSNIINPPSY